MTTSNEITVRSSEQAEHRNGHTKQSDTTYRPPLDVYDLGDRYELHVDLPGASAGDIDVSVQDGVLDIGARVPRRYEGEHLKALHREFGVGDYRRQIRLGEDIDSDGLSAEYRLGVLTVMLPKQSQRQPRRVEVRAG